MKRLTWTFRSLLAVGLALAMGVPALADVRYTLSTPQGEALMLNAVNQKRENDSLVLYTADFGETTRTNAYGVEVSAMPVPGKPGQYKVVKTTSIFECQKTNTLNACGNMTIPSQGVVLSASGTQRDTLLNSFKPGQIFNLNAQLVYDNRVTLNVQNPTPESNPIGSGFPGFRGGNQLIMYDAAYGQPTTGTNEFGYEVTVVDGRVVKAEGANSTIPDTPGAFVLSGHGKAREWLIQNAPIGAKIERDGEIIISRVDKQTYLSQLDTLVQQIDDMKPNAIPSKLRTAIQQLRAKALQMPDEDVAHQALALKQELTPVLWASYPSVQQQAPKAIWHRPSEASLAEVRQSLDMLKKSGINTLYLETYLHGDPIFPSSTFAAYNIPQKRPFAWHGKPDDDVLQIWLDEAHQRGMKVHVWFQTFYAGNKQFDGGMGSILTAHPDWANIQRSGLGKSPLPPSTLEAGSYFIDPANQQAQRFLLSLIEEIVTRYPVDGFQLDYIRYPASFPPDRFSYVATTWGYSDVARRVFYNRFGVDPANLSPKDQPELWDEWNAFKTRQVDRFVAKAHETIKNVKPDLPLSVAIFPKANESLSRKHQNWVAWAREGLVDAVAPMTLTSSIDTIASDTRLVRQQTTVPVITGVFGPFNGNSPTDVVAQVWAAISNGATGIALFDTAHLTQRMGEALNMGLFKSSTPDP